jgi:FAD/FMN-containing dehydrogenase
VGGVISTNAGGLRAVRWGVARDMVLGLEAVLADGRVVTGLTKTLKDNAGYDWKHLMIGSEGTLGVVTRATLRLRPMPRSTMTALLGTDDFEKIVGLLRDLDADLGGQLTSFEVMWQDFYTMITEANRAKRAPPMPASHHFYVLVEAMGGDPAGDPARFEAALAAAIARGQAADAVIAQSGRERDALWAVREDLMEPMRKLWPMFAFDVSVALGDMAVTAERAIAAIRGEFPAARILTYGHAGDGNLHFVVGVGDNSPAAEHRVDLAVYRAVAEVGGSISAEHGVGLTKRGYLGFSRSADEIALMRILKAALDPGNILNPGKILPPASALQ